MECFPHPLPTYEQFLTSFICCGWAYEAIIRQFQHVYRPKFGKSSEIMVHCRAANDTFVQWQRAEALTQHGTVSISPPNICWKVVDKLHMLWMGIWCHILPITTTWVVPDLGSLLKLWFTAGLQLTPLCSGWGSNPTWNGSHISSQHMQGGWQPSYAVDGHMKPS